jgi:DNA-directed RNA polymerase sigma subunit (sigma70/sigma32)
MAKSAAALRSSPRPTVATRSKAVDNKTTNRLANLTPAPTPNTAPRAMTEAELEVIWKTFKRTRDENLRNTLIEHHMPLVRSIAERVLQTLPKSIDVDDLSSAGTFGLMDAINGFDLSRGIKFKTYCTTRIRGSILDELRSHADALDDFVLLRRGTRLSVLPVTAAQWKHILTLEKQRP